MEWQSVCPNDLIEVVKFDENVKTYLRDGRLQRLRKWETRKALVLSCVWRNIPYCWNDFGRNIGLQGLKIAILALYVKFYTLLNISSSCLTAEGGKGQTVLTGDRKTWPMLEGFCHELPRRTRIEQNSSWYLSDGIGFLDDYINYCRLQDNCSSRTRTYVACWDLRAGAAAFMLGSDSDINFDGRRLRQWSCRPQ